MKALKSWAKVNEAFYKYVVDPTRANSCAYNLVRVPHHKLRKPSVRPRA
jgi:hypothetical protein